jgi:hypothetical protein
MLRDLGGGIRQGLAEVLWPAPPKGNMATPQDHLCPQPITALARARQTVNHQGSSAGLMIW